MKLRSDTMQTPVDALDALAVAPDAQAAGPAGPDPHAGPEVGPHAGTHTGRRRLLRWVAAAGGGGLAGWPALLPGLAAAAEPAEGPEPPRLALLIGNRDYPDGEDLPPIHKNVRDLRDALERRGFAVTDALDQDLVAAQALMARFVATVKAAPADATVFFYFSGHGAQVDAENLLVSAHISPKARPDALTRASLTLTKDVIGQLPLRPDGLTIAVIDACRTSLKAVAQGEGLNQVEAPPGCLIAFATGAGKPAIAPNNDANNTFYTGSLVKVMNSASGETPFSDVFRLVKTDTQNTMLNHPVKILREFAQVPFIAENTKTRRRLAPRVPDAPPPPPRKDDESVAWARLEALIWPADVARAATAYLADYPDSQLAGSAQVARDGAAEAAQILRRNDVRLYRSAFQLGEQVPADAATDIVKAGRGDKDAAARLGQRNSPDGGLYGGVDKTGRYEGWMQYAAALGNGIASYRLALYYRRTDQPQLASQFEALARKLGYTPPPSLDNKRS